MTVDDYLLLWLVQYGLPVLFGVVVLASMGVPLPATLLVLTAGAFVEQGEWDMWQVVALATGAAFLGDQLGYGIGRWGSQPLVARLGRWSGRPARFQQAERIVQRWGGIGIFLSRWLFAPVGPIINLTSGVARYPWVAFVGFDLAGEIVWALLYVWLGRLFSDQVQTLSSTLGDFTWVAVGVATMLVLVWMLRRQRRAPETFSGRRLASLAHLRKK